MTELTNTPPRLKRADVPAYLLARHGITRTAGTLAKLAVVGGGPAFRKVGTRTVLYDTSDIDTWAVSLLSAPVSSTSELNAA